MKKILVCGNILSELALSFDKAITEEAMLIVDDAKTLTSSKVINVARIMSPKCKIIFCGIVGSDQEGEKAIKDLKKYGFDTQLVQTLKGEKTGRIVTISPQEGFKSSFLFIGANKNHNINNVPEEVVKNVDAIYTSTWSALDFVYALIEKAELNNTPVFMEIPSKHKEFDKSKKHKIEFLMPNRFEASSLTGMQIDTVEDAKQACLEIRKFIDGNILITLDKDGVIFLNKDKLEVEHYPGEILQPLDSTGAGDVFRGVFASEILNGKDTASSIIKANKLASMSVLIKGVGKKIEQVESYFKQNL